MNIITRWLRKALATVGTAISVRFFGGQYVAYPDNKLTYIERGYEGNDIIYAVVNLIVETAKIAPWAWYRIVDEQSYKRYIVELNKARPDFQKAAEYKKKGLEYYTGNKRLEELIKYPNPNQTWAELNGDIWTFELVTGDAYEYWDVTGGGLNEGLPKTMSALPSQYMVIETTNTLPIQPARYLLQLGQNLWFDPEQVLHTKLTSLNWSVIGIQLYGMSPLKPASPRLQRNNESQKAGSVAQRNGGMRGIAYYDDPRLDPNDDRTFEQMGKQKKTFQDEMRPGTDGTGHVMFSQWKMGYQQVGFSPKDLDTSTIELNDLRMFCSIYGVPSQLLNDPSAKTYNTTIEAEKALITRCVIPRLRSRRDAINRKMARTDGIVIDFDLSVYDQLQPNKTAIAEWANKMPITNARKLEIIGEDVPETMTEDERNAVLIPTGMVNLADVVAPMPEDQQNEIAQLEQAGLNPYNFKK